jgi:predicted DCC family thiol-disulfide oxidoreductase YuxK
MGKLLDRPLYSYREDASVPAFDDEGPVVVMDGNCMMCSQGARVISHLDRKRVFRICPSQTPLGTALLAHYGLAPDHPESWLFLDKGKAHASLQAITGIGRRLGGIGWLLTPAGLLPLGLQDWLYRRIAYNRYRVFGTSDMCAMPDPALQARLIGR